MPEVILFEPDPESRMLLRTLLERDGFEVSEAENEPQARDVVRASKAQTVVMSLATQRASERFVAELARTRPDLDILTPPGWGRALLEGAALRDGVADFARDAVLLLAVLAEEGAKQPAAAEKIARLAELTAIRLGLGKLNTEATAAAATLVALGASLVAFRFGQDTSKSAGASVVTVNPSASGQVASIGAEGSASGGVGKDIQAVLAAVSAVRAPYPLRAIIEAVEERWDGRGRPLGLKGERIPIAARILAVTREYAQHVAGGSDDVVAAELVRSRAGSEYDPKVVDGFFRALRDESYLDKLEGGRRGPKVLVADPDHAALAVAELRLNAAGFTVITCDDGQKAADMIASDPPEAVIMETVLPRLDGISLLLKLRREPATQAIPVIFTSARTDAALLNKALKLGAKDVIAKPVNFDVLVAKLRALAGAAAAKAAAAPGGGGAVQGDLAEMPLSDFFQVLALGRRTVKVVATSPEGQGQVFFERGAPVAAFTKTTRGMDAFASIVSWTQGSFALSSGDVAPERNLDAPGLEAMLLAVGSAHDDGQGPGIMSGPAASRGPTTSTPTKGPSASSTNVEFDFEK